MLESTLALPLCTRDGVAVAAVFYGLVGWQGLSVIIVFILKFKDHLCVHGWRNIQDLSLCRPGSLFSIKSLFISRRVKVWPGGQNATNTCVTSVVNAKEAYVCLLQITLCEDKLLRNIDFTTDILLSWHHQFLKYVLLFQQNSLYQPQDVGLYSHICPSGLFQAILSLTNWNQGLSV